MKRQAAAQHTSACARFFTRMLAWTPKIHSNCAPTLNPRQAPYVFRMSEFLPARVCMWRFVSVCVFVSVCACGVCRIAVGSISSFATGIARHCDGNVLIFLTFAMVVNAITDVGYSRYSRHTRDTVCVFFSLVWSDGDNGDTDVEHGIIGSNDKSSLYAYHRRPIANKTPPNARKESQ